jgi:hypothetical protein
MIPLTYTNEHARMNSVNQALEPDEAYEKILKEGPFYDPNDERTYWYWSFHNRQFVLTKQTFGKIALIYPDYRKK